MPAPAVLVDFRVAGLEDVARAVGSVQQSLDRLARSSASGAQKSARERTTAEQNVSREVERLAKSRERTQATAARVEQRALEQSSRAQQRAAEQSVRAVERAEQQKTRAVEKAATDRTRALERAAATEARIAEQTARTHERHSRAMAAKGSSMVMGGVGRVMGAAGTIAGTVAAVGGGFTLVDAITSANRREAAAGQIVRSAAENKAGLTKTDLLAKARVAHVSSGVGIDDALTGIDSFVRKNGSLSATTEMLPELSGLAAASGASMEDLGTTAGDIYNKTGSAAKTKAALRMIAAQGKAGAIDVRDLGEYGPRLTAAAGLYQGDVVQNIGKMSALAQFAVASGSAHNARVGTESALTVASDLAKHGAEIRAKLGINVWADKDHTMLAPAEDTIAKMVVKSKGSQSKLLDLVGAESMHAVRAFSNTYSRAGGGAAGEAAMRGAFASIAAPTMSDSEIAKGVADKLTENATQMDQAVERIKVSFQQFAPVATKMADEFARYAPDIAKALQSLLEHPFAGLGAIVAAAVTAEIAKAALGAAIEQAILAAMGKRGAAGVAGEVGGGLLGGAGKGGLLGAGLRVAGTATIVGAAAVAAAHYGGQALAENQDALGAYVPNFVTKNLIGPDATDGSKSAAATEAARKAGAVRELAGFAGTIGNPFGMAHGAGGSPSSGGAGGASAQHAQIDGAAKKMGAAAGEADKLTAALAGATEAAQAFARNMPADGARPPIGH